MQIKNSKKPEDRYEEPDNLGLDADRSSDDGRSYDDDSERTFDPNGEGDNRYGKNERSAPLDDK